VAGRAALLASFCRFPELLKLFVQKNCIFARESPQINQESGRKNKIRGSWPSYDGHPFSGTTIMRQKAAMKETSPSTSYILVIQFLQSCKTANRHDTVFTFSLRALEFWLSHRIASQNEWVTSADRLRRKPWTTRVIWISQLQIPDSIHPAWVKLHNTPWTLVPSLENCNWES